MSSRWKWSVFALIAFAAMSWMVWERSEPANPSATEPQSSLVSVTGTPRSEPARKYDPQQAAAAWAVIAPKLQAAQDDMKNEAKKAIVPIRQFFSERKRHSRRFAEDTLSWGGKLSYVQNFFDEGAHSRRIHTSFERLVFSDKELTEVIESAIRSYLSAVQGRENQLLVDIRADLPDELMPSGPIAAPPDLGTLRRQFSDLVRQVSPSVAHDLGVSVGMEAVSNFAANLAMTVLTDLAKTVAARAGVSGGILATGAGSTVATLGVGLVASLVIDRILDWLIREAGYDPEKIVAAKLESCLWELETALLEGAVIPATPSPKTGQRLLAPGGNAPNRQQSTSNPFDVWGVAPDSSNLFPGDNGELFAWPFERAEVTFETLWGGDLPRTLGLISRLEQAGDARGKLWEIALRKLIFEGGDR